MATGVNIGLLEQLAFNTWPAAVQWSYGDWIARYSGGVTRRANSVYTSGSMPGNDDWLKDIEAFYARNRLPARFHISPASPDGLDERLEKEGYVKNTVTTMMIGDCREVVQRTSPPDVSPEKSDGPAFEAVLLNNADDDWIDGFLQAEQFPELRRPFYEGLCGRIAPECAFLSIRMNGKIAGVGTAVTERGWAGFTNIAAHPDFRRRGVGTFILHHLASWALKRGAERLYLQVMADNAPAVSLYEKSGYRRLYDYHYRDKE
ncbi:GNAT family N-acetyltransferase [Paenibacillus hamazuiensis]|uniref:GNAT family N-acetyltransferase n=1 Tax=Paenibacillus hamazuiensis TaxID=2936508 RepID=UPI00200E13A3|nr:GNAT family N-acetyltransferase [Paenibacillus hamazuiensis]